MTTPWEYLINGSMVRAAYEAYNQPFAFSGVQNYPIGILFIVFQILLFIKTRNIAFHFIVSIISFVVLFRFIPVIMKGIILVILLLELAGILYLWAVKEQ